MASRLSPAILFLLDFMDVFHYIVYVTIGVHHIWYDHEGRVFSTIAT